MTQRELFLLHNAQTSNAPLAIHISKAKGEYLFDTDGKQYLDLISGISVANIGHGHPAVVEAIARQAEQYMHVMVYGELVQSPQVLYAQALAQHLAPSLSCVYFTNSGSEATEGAMKLAKRATRRSKIISFKNSYHGSTQGALSVMGSEYWQQAYRPLLPDVYQYDYESEESIQAIDSSTACVILELVQSEAGVLLPHAQWLHRIRQACTEHGALLIVDEIQTGFGRTGSLFRFQALDLLPDILLLGKALGGGMPMGAFVASHHLMAQLSDNPVLGHITTFGGHPVCCAAGLAAWNMLIQSTIVTKVATKEALFVSLLHHPAIVSLHSAGLLIALELESPQFAKQVIDRCIETGLFTDWFLFASQSIRIAPPLTITEEQIQWACHTLLEAIDYVISKRMNQ